MTPAQVLAAINAPVALNGTGGFTGAGGTVGMAACGRSPIQAAGLNGGVAVTVNTLLATDTAAQAATKINAALDALGGGDGGISVDGSSAASSSGRRRYGTIRRRSPATVRRSTPSAMLAGNRDRRGRHRAARHARRHARSVGPISYLESVDRRHADRDRRLGARRC